MVGSHGRLEAAPLPGFYKKGADEGAANHKGEARDTLYRPPFDLLGELGAGEQVAFHAQGNDFRALGLFCRMSVPSRSRAVSI